MNKKNTVYVRIHEFNSESFNRMACLGWPRFPSNSFHEMSRATVRKKVWNRSHLGRRTVYCRAIYIHLRGCVPSISSGLDRDQIDWSFTKT